MKQQADVQDLIASAASPEPLDVRAPSVLKSRIYSRLVQEQASTGPLLSLPETKASGAKLCIFEELVRLAPIGEAAKTMNCCRTCRARVVAERFEHAPIYWPNCPYAQFQKR
jgi:hypothetical protein